jgi:hypothetical protein
MEKKTDKNVGEVDLAYGYLMKHSNKSPATLLAYLEKYRRIKRGCKDCACSYDGLRLEEQDYCELRTLFPELFVTPFPCPENPVFTYVDLFSGIGGFHQAMWQLG